MLATVLVGAAAAITWFQNRPAPSPLPPQAAIAARIEAMTPKDAYTAAVGLAKAGKHWESLAYFRRGLAGVRVPSWPLYFDYSSTLYNATLEGHRVRGHEVRPCRSSYERVALMRESIAGFETALGLTDNPHDRAAVLLRRGSLWDIWGFPWESASDARVARRIDPQSSTASAQLHASMTRLEIPSAPP